MPCLRRTREPWRRRPSQRRRRPPTTCCARSTPAATGVVAGTIALGGKPEFGTSDGKGHVFVNLEDKSEVVALDSKKLEVTAHWPLAPGEEPSGMAIDVANHRLFVGCGGNQKMVV